MRRYASRAYACVCAVGLLLSAHPGFAQGVVIYRCTSPAGALTIQNDVPCPKGSKQERRVIEPAQTVTTPTLPIPPPPLVPVAAPALISPAPPIDSSQGSTIAPVADAERLPPPPLYQCNTYDNDSYMSESIVETPRCVRLETVGADGHAESGAGEACEMKTDQCQRVPDAAACDGWRKRLREVESTWRFSRAGDKEALQAEFRRVSEILNASTCGL